MTRKDYSDYGGFMRVQSTQESFQTFLDNNFDRGKKFLGRKEERALIALAKVELAENRHPCPAFNELLACNYRMILRCAKRFAKYGFELDDLFQVGVLGFKRAIEKFDLGRGFRLLTYAMQWVDSKIRRHIIMHDDTIHVPNHLARHISAMRREAAKVRSTEGRHPTDKELLKVLNLKGVRKNSRKGTRVSALQLYRLKSISIDRKIPTPSGNPVTILDRLELDSEKSPFELVSKKEQRERVRYVLRYLTQLERAVIKLRFVREHSFDHCAKILFRAHLTRKQVSGERVRQIEERVLGGLKPLFLRAGIRESE